MTDPNTIEGPGALILVASCDPNVPFVAQSIRAVGVDFSIVKSDRKSQGESMGVRISAAESTASQVRSTPAHAESRDATERSRAGSRSVLARWRPAEADGWRKRGASPCLRARAARSAGSTMARRNSAARGGSSWRSETGPLPSGRLPVFLGSAGLRRLTLRVSVTCRAALTEIETLRFERKECCVSQKK